MESYPKFWVFLALRGPRGKESGAGWEEEQLGRREGQPFLSYISYVDSGKGCPLFEPLFNLIN